MTSLLPGEAILRRNDRLPSAELDGELMFLSAARGRYLGLSGTGREVWDLLEKPRSVTSLIDTLSTRYRLSPAEMSADLMPFLSSMVAESLIDLDAEQ